MRWELEEEFDLCFHSSNQWYDLTSAPVIFVTPIIFIAHLWSILAGRWWRVPRLAWWVTRTWTAWERERERVERSILMPIISIKSLQELFQELWWLFTLPVWWRTWAVVRTYSRVVWTRKRKKKHPNEKVYVNPLPERQIDRICKEKFFFFFGGVVGGVGGG